MYFSRRLLGRVQRKAWTRLPLLRTLVEEAGFRGALGLFLRMAEWIRA
jgi:hypothetical protein